MLHDLYPNVEWSGLGFYESGKSGYFIKFFVPLSIDDATLTSFSSSSELMDLYDQFPETEDMETAWIHTHHRMNAYYSSTDEEAIDQFLKTRDSILSVVLNQKGNYVAKMSYLEDFTSYSEYRNISVSHKARVDEELEINRYNAESQSIVELSILGQKEESKKREIRSKQNRKTKESWKNSMEDFQEPSGQINTTPHLFSDWEG